MPSIFFTCRTGGKTKNYNCYTTANYSKTLRSLSADAGFQAGGHCKLEKNYLNDCAIGAAVQIRFGIYNIKVLQRNN